MALSGCVGVDCSQPHQSAPRGIAAHSEEASLLRSFYGTMERVLAAVLLLFGETQPALAPHNAGNLLDQMFLGGSLWSMFGHQRCHDRMIFVGIFPGQHGIARQHAML